MASKVNNNISSSSYCKACGAVNPAQAIHCFACHESLSNVTGGTTATTNPLTGLLIPAVIIHQRYRILDVLSTGEVNTVYKAEDIQLGKRIIALKEIGQNNQHTQAALALIEASRREMLLLADLIHPNLPRIYDYFVENQRWYFVMDFLPGETLAAYLKQRKYRPLSVEEVVDIGIQLSTALDYLHVHHLGFNDLTLNTIWRTPDGKLYLLDIGAAVSATATLRINPIYSLGMILRQLQTGKIPARSRLHAALPKPRKSAKPAQSGPLKVLIEQMVHKDIRKRPYHMGIVKQELQLLMTQYNAPKKRGFSRRSLLKMGGSLTGLAGLAVASSWVTWQVEILSQKQIPITSYSPHLGGTISTYNAQSGVLTVAWSPDGTRLAMGNWSGQIQAWDAKTGHHVINFPGTGFKQVFSLIWLPDGSSIVAGGNNPVVWVWNAATGEVQNNYQSQTGNIQNNYQGQTVGIISVACSPNNKYIASGGYDQTVQVWEAATGRQVVIYRRHSGGIGSVAWSPDGRYIASASFDMTVQIWDATTGRHIFTYRGHTDQVYTVAWSPDGQHIASGGKDNTVQVWEAMTGHTIFTYHGHPMAVQDLAWSPNSSTIASAADNVQLWNSLTGEHIYTYTKHSTSITREVQAVAWSPNGRYIASGGMEGTVQVWNAV